MDEEIKTVQNNNPVNQASTLTKSEQVSSNDVQGSMEQAAQRIKALSQKEDTTLQNVDESEDNALHKQQVESDNANIISSDDNDDLSIDENNESEIKEEIQLLDVDAEKDASKQVEIDASQFSKLLSLNEDQLLVNDEGSITFKTKVDGIESDVTLPDLIKSYQNEATLTNRSMEVNAIIKARNESLQGAKAMAEQQATYTATLLETLNNEYLGDLKQADLDQLRIDDPAEYSAKQIEFSQRQNKIKELATQSLSLLQEQQNNQDVEQQRIDSERIPIEAKALRDYFKPLKVEVNQLLQNDLSAYLNTQNYSADEIDKNIDSRLMILAYKAKQYDQGMRRATDKKVIRKLPKVIKSGTKPSDKVVTEQRKIELQSKARKSGSLEDALARVRNLN